MGILVLGRFGKLGAAAKQFSLTAINIQNGHRGSPKVNPRQVPKYRRAKSARAYSSYCLSHKCPAGSGCRGEVIVRMSWTIACQATMSARVTHEQLDINVP